VLFSGDKNFDYQFPEIQNSFKIISELSGKHIISISCGFHHCVALQGLF
jgi:hypothetical protein